MSINPETRPGTKKRRPHSNEHPGGIPEPTQHDQSPAIGNITAMKLQQLMRNSHPNTTLLYYESDKRK
jgi:hypothetical protein